tara:strand:- start:183 stop:722 length:540 start_codon:yes stop_codon:yes gene_type:complete
LKKNLTTIKDFVDTSIGEWKSIRSTHTLAFQEFENTISSLIISYQHIESEEVLEIKKKFTFSQDHSFAVNITWKSASEWTTDNKSKESQTILIFVPKDEYTGTIIKDKGYAELIPSSSKYYMDESKTFNIQSEYKATISEEKIWFLAQNVRSRYSVIKNKINNGIMQTSHATEIRKLIT